ncbi:MAG: hypothetical protein NT030_02020 [Candidatus Saganbacteria bacterium]|nr:hypothetical protein [Candidatus Saganbacteria bacterium]
MRIVLLKDVPGLGAKDEAYEVRDGYARNFLLPRGAAIVATTALLEKLKGKIKRNEARIKKEADEFRVKEPIKTVGTAEVLVKLYHAVEAKVKIKVIPAS